MGLYDELYHRRIRIKLMHEIGHYVAHLLLNKSNNSYKSEYVEFQYIDEVKDYLAKFKSNIPDDIYEWDSNLLPYELLSLPSGCIWESYYIRNKLPFIESRLEFINCFEKYGSCSGRNDYHKFYRLNDRFLNKKFSIKTLNEKVVASYYECLMSVEHLLNNELYPYIENKSTEIYNSLNNDNEMSYKIEGDDLIALKVLLEKNFISHNMEKLVNIIEEIKTIIETATKT